MATETPRFAWRIVAWPVDPKLLWLPGDLGHATEASLKVLPKGFFNDASPRTLYLVCLAIVDGSQMH